MAHIRQFENDESFNETSQFATIAKLYNYTNVCTTQSNDQCRYRRQRISSTVSAERNYENVKRIHAVMTTPTCSSTSVSRIHRKHRRCFDTADSATRRWCIDWNKKHATHSNYLFNECNVTSRTRKSLPSAKTTHRFASVLQQLRSPSETHSKDLRRIHDWKKRNVVTRPRHVANIWT